jgi:quercetin dioxygenase-like cupin family protein
MKRNVWILVFTFAAGTAAGLIADRVLNAQQDPVKRTVLLKTDLEGVQGKDATAFVIELAPGAATGRHYHPGHEIAYVLEGTASVHIDGRPPTTQQRGAVIHLTPKLVHDVKNPSKREPMKAVVFALYEKGQPTTTPVK